MIRQVSEGTILAVRAIPGARENCVGGSRQGALLVRVTAAAEKGKANAAILALLADALGVPRRAITLLSGATRRDKQFLIRGLRADRVKAHLDALDNGHNAVP